MEMTPLYSPKSESEASVLTAMMQAYDIDFLMQGAAFSTMYPGPVTSSLNAQVLMVRSDQFELARELLASLLQSSDGPDDKSTEHK